MYLFTAADRCKMPLRPVDACGSYTRCVEEAGGYLRVSVCVLCIPASAGAVFLVFVADKIAPKEMRNVRYAQVVLKSINYTRKKNRFSKEALSQSWLE